MSISHTSRGNGPSKETLKIFMCFGTQIICTSQEHRKVNGEVLFFFAFYFYCFWLKDWGSTSSVVKSPIRLSCREYGVDLGVNFNAAFGKNYYLQNCYEFHTCQKLDACKYFLKRGIKQSGDKNIRYEFVVEIFEVDETIKVTSNVDQ